MDCFDEPPPFEEPSINANMRVMEFYDCRIREHVDMKYVSLFKHNFHFLFKIFNVLDVLEYGSMFNFVALGFFCS